MSWIRALCVLFAWWGLRMHALFYDEAMVRLISRAERDAYVWQSLWVTVTHMMSARR